MTNPHDKAIEAAAESIRKCLEAIGAEAGTNTCHAIARSAIAAYERAMWRPVNEHNGSRDEMLIANGETMWTGLTFAEWTPFQGIALASLNRDGEWSAGYAEEYDNEILHRPAYVRPLPTVPEGEE